MEFWLKQNNNKKMPDTQSLQFRQFPRWTNTCHRSVELMHAWDFHPPGRHGTRGLCLGKSCFLQQKTWSIFHQLKPCKNIRSWYRRRGIQPGNGIMQIFYLFDEALHLYICVYIYASLSAILFNTHSALFSFFILFKWALCSCCRSVNFSILILHMLLFPGYRAP